VNFHGPDEIRVFEDHLRQPAFEVVNLAPAALDDHDWLRRACRTGVRCDVLVLSGEFGGRFFGSYGFSLGLQELEEASCRAECAGIFQAPSEVFLLACNTLATKDQDNRTPREYLQVLRDHGFDQASAERVVQTRYGPIGPSFRESLRRVFAGVPRVYGFASVAPRGMYTGPMLERYFASGGDYATFLQRAGRRGDRNGRLLAAFKDTSLVQVTGLADGEPGAADRAIVCRLYDEDLSVAERLRTMVDVMGRGEVLTFLPTLEAFLEAHPPERFTEAEEASFATVRAMPEARDEILRLVRDLEVSALQLEVAHFARHLGWMTAEEFTAVAVEGTRALLARPLTSEIVDIECEIARHERVGDAIRSEHLPGMLFGDAEGIRLVDCVASADPRVTDRLAPALDSADPTTRIWAAYALSHRLPLPEPVLLRLVPRLRDPSPDVRGRARWIFVAERRLPSRVREAIESHDPELAEDLGRGGRRR
jgi:hypothetical protein